jgi:hypothetical protein
MSGHISLHDHDRPAVHGMLMVGTGPIFLSHLPMFHPPHDLQLIVDVALTGDADPARAYRDDRARSGEKLYTWVPKPFVLRDLLREDRPAVMTGNVFRGHFERGGVAITPLIQASVVSVVYVQRLHAAGLRDATLRYHVFGESPSVFAAHHITAAPDFDSVISVAADVSALRTNRSLVTIPSRPNTPAGRLRSGEEAQASIGTIICREEMHFETGDLAG